MLRWLAMLAVLMMPAVAWSQSCTFTISDMNFGVVDTLSGAATNSTSTLNMTCQGAQRILICPSLSLGGAGGTAATRVMTGGISQLNYQLYSDPGRSVVWGSHVSSPPPAPPGFSLTPSNFSSVSGTATIFGSVAGGQGTARVLLYTSDFSGSRTDIHYFYSAGNDCTTGEGSSASAPFQVRATVAANCLLTILDIDFGAQQVISGNIDATGQVSVKCTPSTPYTVSLGNGTTGTGPAARRMVKAGVGITYGLYRNAARNQVWGDATTPGSTVAGSGSGVAQPLTVYGRVPPQATPSPGVYNDTVVVTVTY